MEVKAEAFGKWARAWKLAPETVLMVDVDITLLKDLHHHGSVQNLKDRRKDVYALARL